MVSQYRYYVLAQAALAVVLIWLRNLLFKIIYKGNAPPRPGDASVSRQWVEGIIRANGFPNVVVESIVVGSNENNRGLVNAITKIKVNYAPEHRTNPALPAGFVLKTNKGGYQGIASCIGFRAYREASFFNVENVVVSTAPKSSSKSSSGSQGTNSSPKGLYPNSLSKAFGDNVPYAWYSYNSPLLGEHVVLQQDISLSHMCVPLNFVFGNQVWGVPAPVEPPRDIVQSLKTVFTTAATHHATFWNNPALIKQEWLKGALWYQGKERTHWEYCVEATRKYWKNAKAKAAIPANGITISPKILAIIDKSLQLTNWDDFQAHLKANPFTLVHGDFHASNLFLYRKEGDDTDIPAWFDWSEVGVYDPATDLAQMLVSDVKPEITAAHSKELVRLYYDTLLKNGISEKDYTWQQCWNNFCNGGPERWIWFFCLLAGLPLPANAIQFFHDQLLAFINHHCPSADHFKLKILAAAL